MEAAAYQPSPSPFWSNVVKSQAAAPEKPNTKPADQMIVESCKSREGISIAVIDANAVIEGGERLNNLADKLVTVPEVLAEIRDPVSRHRLAFFPSTIDSMEPTTEALKKVIKFARATGDLQTLSDVDMKLIALTYTLEGQIHGTKHLKDSPPPVHTVNVKKLPEKDMPGWGSNVPNLEEWEALENYGDGSNNNSRILPLTDITLNVIASDDQSEGDSVGTAGEVHSENHVDIEHGLMKNRRYPPKKREIKIEGKKMIADGIDASQGQFDDNDGVWMPAISRSTHRRYLRRKARREYNEAWSNKDSEQDLEKSMDRNKIELVGGSNIQLHRSSGTAYAGDEISEEGDGMDVKNGDVDLSSTIKEMRLEEGSLQTMQEGKDDNTFSGVEFNNFTMMETALDDHANLVETGESDVHTELDHVEILSQTNESVDASCVDDDISERSWMLRSLSESSVACVTSDFAMQNVILQMGLRLLAPGGMQIRQLHRWILKCHACYTVTAEIGRIFCPKCGNGGTLRKVAVTVGENGIILAARCPRITLRGTKFSLPLPRGGRDAIAKNPILREDQLPQKFLQPKTKKKVTKQGDEFLAPGDVFSHHTDKRGPFQPPVRKALAFFSGRRNPNDNHYAPKRH